MNQLKNNTPSYRAEIDGLRAFAVLSVVGFHAFPTWFKGGFVGVDVFFVISGFLITCNIFDRLNKNTFSFTDFFCRRVRRIFPALILVMVSSLAFGSLVLFSDEFSQLSKHVAGGSGFIVNFLLSNEVGYFDNAAETKPMLHLWSLAVEEQFYIIWPICLWVAYKLNFNLLLVTLVIGISSFGFNLLLVTIRPIEIFFFPFGRFWELLSGSILAWFVINRRTCLSNTKLENIEQLLKLSPSENKNKLKIIAVNVCSFCGLSLLCLSLWFIHKELPFPSIYALAPIIGSLLVIIAGSKARLNRIFLMNPIATWFGLISYPLYLWHWPILSFLQIIEDEWPSRTERIIAIIFSTLLAWLTCKFLENPIRFSKNKERLKSFFLFFSLCILGLTSFAMSITNWPNKNTVDSLILRKGLEHRIGSSNYWYEGKDNWLFLGNAHNQTVKKLKSESKPEKHHIEKALNEFSSYSKAAADRNVKLALFIGPNKSSVYPDKLPDILIPSRNRYFSYFAEKLGTIDNLFLFDPTETLLKLKETKGILYHRTDSHWNSKGAFFAYSEFLRCINLPIPDTNFQPWPPTRGDIIKKYDLDYFPIKSGDNWNFLFVNKPKLTRQVSSKQQSLFFDSKALTPFGSEEIVLNQNSLSNKRVWVIGDSFVTALRAYINVTFKEVHYLGHVDEKLKNLSIELKKANDLPDLIIIVRVERSF